MFNYSLTPVKQPVIRGVLTNYNVSVSILSTIVIEVMNLRARWQRLAKRSFRNHPMLPF